MSNERATNGVYLRRGDKTLMNATMGMTMAFGASASACQPQNDQL